MRVSTATLMALAALAAPTAAEARSGPPLQPYEAKPSPFTLPASDGVRYFVTTPSQGVVRIHDTATDRRRDVAVSQYCQATAAHAGTALLNCYDDPEMPYELDLRTGTLVPVKRQERLSQHYQSWYGMGRHWIKGTAVSSKPATAYVNRTTGEVHVESSYDGNDDLNLDDPKLRPHPASVVAVDGSRSIRFRDGMWLVQPGADVRLSRCPAGCVAPRVSSGLVTWTEGTTARALDIRRRVRLGWRIDTPDENRSIRIVHTRTHVLIAAGDREPLWARVRK